MKSNLRLVAVGVLLLVALSASAVVEPPALDETIQILIVREPGISQSFIDEQLAIVQQAWDTSEFVNGNAPVSITVLNPGIALSTLVNIPDDETGAYLAVKTFVDFEFPGLLSIRDQFAADVVIAFVDDIGNYCGWAPQPDWLGPNGEFNENPFFPGIDDSGKEDWFIALIANDANCGHPLFKDTAAHEFGHLFGAGHYVASFPFSATDKSGLFENSRSLVDDEFEYFPPPFGQGGFTIRYRTALGTDNDVECAGGGGNSCAMAKVYSDRDYNNLNRMNTDAIDQTAVSVAQYRSGGPAQGGAEQCFDGIDNDGDGMEDGMDPECSGGTETGPPPPPPALCDASVAPTIVSGYLVQVCVIPSGMGTPSQYRMHWEHPCPAAVDYYQVWKSQPDGYPYVIGWTKTSPSSDVFVQGSNARLRIKACDVINGCSALSSGSFVAVDLC